MMRGRGSRQTGTSDPGLASRLLQPRIPKRKAVGLREQLQSGRGIRRAAAKAGRHRYPLDQGKVSDFQIEHTRSQRAARLSERDCPSPARTLPAAGPALRARAGRDGSKLNSSVISQKTTRLSISCRAVAAACPQRAA